MYTQLYNENRFLMFGQIGCLCHNVMFVSIKTTSHLTKIAHTLKTTNLSTLTSHAMPSHHPTRTNKDDTLYRDDPPSETAHPTKTTKLTCWPIFQDDQSFKRTSDSKNDLLYKRTSTYSTACLTKTGKQQR